MRNSTHVGPWLWSGAPALPCRHSWRHQLAPLHSSQGTALVECAMVLPLLLLLMLNAMNFSTYIYAWITVSNAARDAAEYQVYNGIPINAPGGPPSYSQVQSVVTADLSTLTNNSSQWTLEICSSSPPNGSTSCSGTGTYTPPADPEPGTYRLYSVDLAYQYSPIFSAFAVPLLGVNLTIPPATIHQQAVMRWMQ